jgi:hypothetical protein
VGPFTWVEGAVIVGADGVREGADQCCGFGESTVRLAYRGSLPDLGTEDAAAISTRRPASVRAPGSTDQRGQRQHKALATRCRSTCRRRWFNRACGRDTSGAPGSAIVIRTPWNLKAADRPVNDRAPGVACVTCDLTRSRAGPKRTPLAVALYLSYGTLRHRPGRAGGILRPICAPPANYAPTCPTTRSRTSSGA